MDPFMQRGSYPGGYSNIPRFNGCAAEQPLFGTKPSLKEPLIFKETSNIKSIIRSDNGISCIRGQANRIGPVCLCV